MSREQVPFALTEYVTAEQLVNHYGTTMTQLPMARRARYENYATNANREVSAFLYRWVDALPLRTDEAAYQYASGMALKYAQRLKQVDDGAANAASFEELYKEDKEVIAAMLRAKPEATTTRRMVSNSYPDRVTPYSQSYGLSDIL